MRRLAWLSILLSACAGDDGPPAWPGEDLPACDTTRVDYVVDELRLGQEDGAPDFGFDLEGDGVEDNHLQPLINVIHSSLHFDPQARTDAALAEDALLIGLTIETCPGQYRTVELHRGLAIDRTTTPPRLTIERVTTLAAVQRPIRIDEIAAQGATRFPPTALFDPEDAAWIDVVAFAVDPYVADDTEVNGVLGGALDPAQLFDAVTPIVHREIVARIAVTPIVHREIVARIAEDPGCPDACTDETAMNLLGTFDADDDLVVTLEEVRTNDIITVLLRAETDVLAEVDGEPTYWPLHDDVDDSVSFGLGFHAERADFDE